MKLYNKIKWALGITLIFGLVLTTNLIDRNNFVQVKDSVVNIYEDRLMAKYHIYEISKLIHDKEIAILKEDTIRFEKRLKTINQNINLSISSYEKTKLTPEEAEVFQNLKDNLENLEKVEVKFLNNNFEEKSNIVGLLDETTEILDALSQIQLTEGNRQMNITKRAVEDIELFTQLEIYFLIFLAILIQIVILYNPKTKKPD